MFDRIARRYDLLNHLLSCGQDVVWRDRLAANLPEGPDQCILDLATGTGDVLLALNRQGDRVRSTVGLDRSLQMLAIGRDRLRSELPPCIGRTNRNQRAHEEVPCDAYRRR